MFKYLFISFILFKIFSPVQIESFGAEPPIQSLVAEVVEVKPPFSHNYTFFPEIINYKIEKPQVEEAKPVQIIKWQDNPFNCDQDTQWIRADNFECINKQIPIVINEPKPVDTGIKQQLPIIPIAVTNSPNQQEIIDYICSKNWDCDLATKIARCESGLNPYAKNTVYPDYSIGIFQINILGALASGRPSEESLYDYKANIDFAYQMYKWAGGSFRDWSCSNKV